MMKWTNTKEALPEECDFNPDDIDSNVTLCCANCRDTGCAGWYVLDPITDTRLQPFIGFKGAFCSAECVCEYLDIPFFNDDELDYDSFVIGVEKEDRVMEGFSTQELRDVHAACIYKANTLIEDQLYVLNALIRIDVGITEENAVDVEWLTNTAQCLKEISGCMELAAKLFKLISKNESLLKSI